MNMKSCAPDGMRCCRCCFRSTRDAKWSWCSAATRSDRWNEWYRSVVPAVDDPYDLYLEEPCKKDLLCTHDTKFSKPRDELIARAAVV